MKSKGAAARSILRRSRKAVSGGNEFPAHFSPIETIIERVEESLDCLTGLQTVEIAGLQTENEKRLAALAGPQANNEKRMAEELAAIPSPARIAQARKRRTDKLEG